MLPHKSIASLSAQQIFLATKFGNHVTPEGGREIRNDRDYIHQAIATSLSRLQTDYIDLLYWHVLAPLYQAFCLFKKKKDANYLPSPSHRFSGKTPVEEIVATMKEYVEYITNETPRPKDDELTPLPPLAVE